MSHIYCTTACTLMALWYSSPRELPVCIPEESVPRLRNKRYSLFLFWRKSHNFFLGEGAFFFSGGNHFLFWCKSRMGKKNTFLQKRKKNRRGNTRTTQQPPLLLEEVKHIAPTDILGTSGAGKAMEPWREGCFLPYKGEHNQKWLPHPCLLRGPKEGGNATSPLHSRGSPAKANKIRSGCLTPYFYSFLAVGRASK